MDKVDIELHGTVAVIGIDGWRIWRPWRLGPQVLVRWKGGSGAPITRPLAVGDEMRVTLKAHLMKDVDWQAL